MKFAIVIKNLSVSYHNHIILKDLNLQIPDNSLSAIVGPNGGGKTTLIRSIMGFLPATGSITFFNQSLQKYKKHIAYIPQRSSIDWSFPATVMEITMMGCYQSLLTKQEMLQRCHSALSTVGLIDLQDQIISKLSGGQQQRLFLARSLAQQAELYILDEPFMGIDMTTEQIMLNLFLDLKAQGKTVVIVHHDLITIQKYFDFIYFLNRQQITAGPMNTTMTQENINKTFYKKADFHDMSIL